VIGAALAAVGVFGFAPVSAAAATTYYASSTLTGDCMTAATACSLATAAGKTHAGDALIILPDGTYTLTAPLPSINASTVEGMPGQPAPQIVVNGSSQFAAFDLTTGGTITHVAMNVQGIGEGAVTTSSSDTTTIDGITVSFSGQADHILSGGNLIIRDSLITAATGSSKPTNGYAISVVDGSLLLRNTTIDVAVGGNDTAVNVYALTKASTGDLRSSILRGDYDLTYGAASGQTDTVTAEYSNYRTTAMLHSGTGTFTFTGDASDQTTVNPAFVSTSDFHEAASSPTVGAGGPPDLYSGTTDLDGNVLAYGGSTDIGAYRLIAAPTVTAAAASAVTQTSATIAGTVDPRGAAGGASYQLQLTPQGGATQTIPGSASTGAATTAQPVSFSLTGLTPSTTYSYTLSATSSGGTTTTTAQTFTTPAQPTHTSIPALSALHLSPATLCAPHTKHRSCATSSTVAWQDAANATATVTIIEQRAGVRSGSRCVAPPRRHHGHPKRCTRHVTIGHMTHSDVAGTNRLTLTTRPAGRKLAPGTYTLTLTARNSAGTSNALSARFVIRG
jgi:hypothetical protein